VTRNGVIPDVGNADRDPESIEQQMNVKMDSGFAPE
jgi:hypothetical protein